MVSAGNDEAVGQKGEGFVRLPVVALDAAQFVRMVPGGLEAGELDGPVAFDYDASREYKWVT